ncbi:EcsC family protein [Novosphingobium pokkalii]
MSNELSIIEKIKDIVLNVDPASIVKDAQSMGINVSEAADFARQAHNYIHIERLSEKYAAMTAKLCAASGFTSGVGGVTTTLVLAGADIANMAAQLYRLNQKLALLNGFDPENELHNERAQAIFMAALGIDATAQAGIRAIVTKAATENFAKRGPASTPVIRLVMEIAKILGVKLTKAQAGKLIPFVGGFVGGGVNYIFAKSMTKK